MNIFKSIGKAKDYIVDHNGVALILLMVVVIASIVSGYESKFFRKLLITDNYITQKNANDIRNLKNQVQNQKPVVVVQQPVIVKKIIEVKPVVVKQVAPPVPVKAEIHSVGVFGQIKNFFVGSGDPPSHKQPMKEKPIVKEKPVYTPYHYHIIHDDSADK